MNSPNANPAVAAFDFLLGLRESIKHSLRSSPNDAVSVFLNYCGMNFMNSYAQLFQDLLVLHVLREKRNGYFVEIGATNGIDLSNTFVLERFFQWKGLLAEPAQRWCADLRANRSAAIDTRCIWSESGKQLEFFEAEIGELSTLIDFVDKDFNRGNRTKGRRYPVETISLNDLLKTHNCPREIDYMSIDTEGSELSILQAFDFANYDIKIMTVEHNFVEPNRQQIMHLLTAKGFVRVLESLSKFDDWYVRRSIVGL